jgi:hypothetical protein
MISNKDAEIAALKGRLEGLTEYYSKVLKISMKPDYRGDLSDELKRLREEIAEVKNKLNDK